MQRAISQHFTVKTCKYQNGRYSATSLTAHHCLYYLVEVQALGPGLGLAPSFNIILGSWLAYGFLCRCLQRANVVLAVQCSYFWLGGSLCHVVLSFCAIKINPVHMCPLLKSGRLPHYFVKSADCSTIAQKEEKDCLFEPL